MVDNPQGPTGKAAGGGGDGQGGNTPTLAEVQAKLEAAEAKLSEVSGKFDTTSKSYNELRKVWNRTLNERDTKIKDLQGKLVGGNPNPNQPADLDPYDPESLGRVVDERLEASNAQNASLREQTDILGFKTDTPDWREYWDDIQVIVNDPIKVAGVVTRHPDGSVDTRRSLENAKTQVEIARLRTAQAKTDEANANLRGKTQNLRNQGAISGSSASADDDLSGKDPREMTDDELINHPDMPINQGDPPGGRRQG